MDDKTLAAICTPIRDLRDEVWCRVYADEFRAVFADHSADFCGGHASRMADLAVAHMRTPDHRKPEGT